MIAFSCSQCGMKFQVKPEFAGRATRCPTCKNLLVVPAPARHEACVLAGRVDGAASSLAQAGLDGGVTLAQAAAEAGQAPVHDILDRQRGSAGRYVVEQEVARGGMGVVLRAVDCDIRREVAVKYLLDQSDPGKKARFVEEAQITGQLEHPNIVPIHELGVDAQKRLFFSMKMVRGRSLAQVLDELRQYPRAGEKEFPLGRLLNVFVSVCHGLAYAHSRGVVHRDLKPANLMVGDFGEVYVMDWGLAKVLADGPPAAADSAPGFPAEWGPSATEATRVATSRDAEADLTQEGAVMGTPVYMAPEQAQGQVHAIDQRSDVYALGAILYELLALQPPIDREGGSLAVLVRVVEGQIAPPAQRAPERARAGKIPRELSAIAMKALARRPQDRYANVEALRKDVERFQEGRSVSAREDSMREMFVRMVRRNQAVSAVAAVAAVLLTIVAGLSFRAVYAAKVKAETALHALEQEQHVRRERGKKSAPLFVRDAKRSAEAKQVEYGLEQVNVALEYDPELVEGRLVKGQLLIVRKEYAAAGKELEPYVRQRPRDREAGDLLKLCRQATRDDAGATAEFAEVLIRQKAYGLAEQVEQDRDKLVRIYRGRIEAAWPGRGGRLQVKDGKFHLDLGNCPEVKDLGAIKDMPLAGLSLGFCTGLRDLEPLAGMKLVHLDLAGCGRIGNLTPLAGMPLAGLNLPWCGAVKDLTPLAGMPLARLDLGDCPQVNDLKPLEDMPLVWLSLANCKQVQNLAPLRGMKRLAHLRLFGCNRVQDLSPLQTLPLQSLDMAWCNGVSDLTPLHGRPLRFLAIYGCENLHDLGPLESLHLKELLFSPGAITRGMDAVRQMKSLETIGHYHTEASKFKRDVFWKKYDAGDFKK